MKFKILNIFKLKLTLYLIILLRTLWNANNNEDKDITKFKYSFDKTSLYFLNFKRVAYGFNVILMMLKDKIPSQALIIVQEKLQGADEEKVKNLSLVPLKNPIIGLILGLFLGGFGADRFYKGDMGLGIAKIALLFVDGATTFLVIGGFYCLF